MAQECYVCGKKAIYETVTNNIYCCENNACKVEIMEEQYLEEINEDDEEE